MKTWKPSTCECKVEEIYDGSTVVGMGQVLNKCPAHAGVADAALYATLMKEGHQLCGVLRLVLGHENEPTIEQATQQIAEAKTNPNGSSAGIGFKLGIDYVWQFTGAGDNRIFQFALSGANLNPQNKGAIKAALAKRFGTSVEMI